MKDGIVFDIKEFALFDGPGIRTTVFMKGCPLRCQWCHNPEGQSPEPQMMVSVSACVHCGVCARVCTHPNGCVVCGACVPVCKGGFRKIAGTAWSAEALSVRLAKDRDVYDMSGGGVTFSGGEPLMHWDFVRDVCLRLPGIHKAIETSGYASDPDFISAMETCDLVMMDWKVSDPEKHRFYTGVSQEPILRHLRMLCEGVTPFILRMPIIPGVNDEREHFETVAKLVKDARQLIRVDVLPYQPAAGAKYEMIGREYHVDFDERKQPEFFEQVFEENGIAYKRFR